MKQGQFSQEQIVAILQQAEKPDQTIQAICREHGITQTTFYRWRKIYGGMSVSEAQRLKELELQVEECRPFARRFEEGLPSSVNEERLRRLFESGVDPILITSPGFRRGATPLDRVGADPDA